MNAPTPAAPAVTRREYLGYAAGDTASCLYYQTFSLFLLIFYTDTFGLAPAVASTMFLVTRIWDAMADPIMGIIADRTKTRHGKFRPWILWGIVPFSLSGVLVFITPDFSATGKIVYAYFTYSLVMLAYTVVNVPYGALLGVISSKSEERTALASYRFFGAFFGGIIVQGSLLYLVKSLGGGNDRVGYPWAMAILATLAAILFYGTFATTRERISPPAAQGSIWRDLRDLVQNRPWLVLSLAGLVTLIYLSIRNGGMLYYFKYYLRDEAAAAAFMVTGTVISMVGALLAPVIIGWFRDKRTALIVLTLASAAAMAAFYFVQPGQRVLLYACNIAFSLPSSAVFPLVWSMYADTADYGERKFGRRATGLIFSAATFSQKMGWAVGGAFAGFLLALVGFVANAVQGTEALAGIRHMMSTIPAAIAVAVAGIVCFYDLTVPAESPAGKGR